MFLYARSFRDAAKKLAEATEPDSGSTDIEACPVVFLYRHALELQLKAIILGDGGNFLATKPDPLTISKTHSVSWLAQFVSQIIVALGWEPEFKCLGIENLDEFKAAVEEVNSVDPGSYPLRFPGETDKGSFNVREFAANMDALLELLHAAADALAAEWDLRSGVVAIDANQNGGGFEPTIQ